MDYASIVRRSLRTTWQHPYLWLFGFLAAGGSGFGPLGNWGERWNGSEGCGLPAEWLISLLLLIIPLLIVVFVGLFILRIISKGGLIRAAQEIDAGERLRFGLVWQRGLVPFWRLLGIELIVFVVVFLVVITGIAMVAAMVGLGAFAGGPAGAGLLALGLFGLLLLPLIAVSLIAFIIVTYGHRACVIDEAAVFAAFGRGWETLRLHFWPSIAIWLISAGVGLAYFIILLTTGAVLAIPFVLLALIHPLAGLVPGIAVGIIYVAVATGLHSTFQHTLWTLAYGELWGAEVFEGGTRPPGVGYSPGGGPSSGTPGG
jgi:hypothetical protein